MRRIGAAAWTMLFVWIAPGAAVSTLAAREPKVEYLLPAAARPGQSLDLEFRGTNRADAVGVWSNLPGASFQPLPRAKADDKDMLSRWRLTTAPNTPLGYYGVRLATSGGISNLKLMMIDDLPTLGESADNKSRSAAQVLSLPVAVEGTAEPESYDYFRFRAERGQRLAVDVVARRLGSPMDPVIRLLDADGQRDQELAYSDDEEAIGADSRFVHTFDRAGDYLLELRDIRYQGGADYRYRLRLGDFPLATATFPLGVQRGVQATVNVIGTALAPLPPLVVHAPADGSASILRLAARYSQGQGSTPLVIATDRQPEQVEFEPNDSRETASPIDLTGAVSGRFEAPHDRDWFRFEAKQGEHWLLAGCTRTLGVPTDLFLRLYDSVGKQLAEVEDTSGEEGKIDHTFAADGSYYLMVEDLLNRGGAEQAYRVECLRFQPGFSLQVDVDAISVPRGGGLVVNVTPERHGYKGPIELQLAGEQLPFDLSAATSTVEKKGLKFVVPLDQSAAPGRFGVFQVVGKAKIEGQDFSTVARNARALRASLSGLATLPPELDGWVAYGVSSEAADFFRVKPDATTISYLQLLGTATLGLKATRVGKFDGAIRLEIAGLPPGISAPEVTIAKGKTDATIEFKGPRASAEGDYPLRLVAQAEFENRFGKVVSDPLVLRVTRPLVIEATVVGPLVRGGKQKVRIHATRAAGQQQPIQLTWQNLPTAVRGEENFVIPAGQHDVETTLSAQAGSRLGKLVCRLRATTTIHDQTISLS
ncbi:MAG TPA: PPC domain-containing protein, partial [Pirellulales bacterium]|nr:PPC domain-containing protein [Pirellulales bacterium]